MRLSFGLHLTLNCNECGGPLGKEDANLTIYEADCKVLKPMPTGKMIYTCPSCGQRRVKDVPHEEKS